MNKGKFIVVEGMHRTGKTSTINLTLDNLKPERTQKFVYNKGCDKSSAWGKYINSHPSSLFYYVDFAIKTKTRIIPMLSSGKNVIQDRYIYSVDSFWPDCNSSKNKIIRYLMTPLFLQPDIYVQFKANVETIVSRLIDENSNQPYRLDLIAHPDKITRRLEKYQNIYTKMNCVKYEIDTSNLTPKKSAEKFEEILSNI
jgi:thymidylate kinase